jgi:hypothetical protein
MVSSVKGGSLFATISRNSIAIPDLIANNFSLKTIFGWATDKELERYTRDFNREEEARGMLVRLTSRRKQTA